MASRRVDVGQGAPRLATVLGKTTAWFVAGSLVMASACSSDSNVDFDPTSPSGGGSANSGGTKPSGSGSDSGAAQSGGSNGTSGEAQGGSGNSAGSNTTAGKSSGGNSRGGDGGTANNGGTTSEGGKAGSANAGSSSGGKAGNGGSANGGNAGTTSTAGSGGVAGSAGTAGNGGNAGAGGGGGNSDCVLATYGGHSYYFCGVVDSAPAAYTKCQSLGMKMVEIESLGEHTFVIGKQKGQSWLGGTDELKEGEWRWTSTTQVFWDGAPRVDFGGNDGRVDGVYSNFIVGQPNDTNVDGFHENCLAINANGWNDLYCNLTGVRAACEGTGPVILPKP